MPSSNSSNDFSLEGKGALVVGAEHPVGRAAAVALAEAGAKVVLASQEPGTDKQLKEVAKLVTAAGIKGRRSRAGRGDARRRVRHRRPDREGTRRFAHPGQRARRAGLRTGGSRRRHGVRQDHREQSEDGVDVVPGGRARDAHAGRRRHRQYHVGAGGTRRPQRGALLRGEGGGAEPDARTRARMGSQGYPRQRDRGRMARRRIESRRARTTSSARLCSSTCPTIVS